MNKKSILLILCITLSCSSTSFGMLKWLLEATKLRLEDAEQRRQAILNKSKDCKNKNGQNIKQEESKLAKVEEEWGEEKDIAKIIDTTNEMQIVPFNNFKGQKSSTKGYCAIL